MLGTVFFLTALISTVFLTNGTSLRGRDLELILNLLQKRTDKENTSEDSYSSSAAEDGHSFADHVKNMNVLQLIQLATKLKNKLGNEIPKQRYRTSYNSADNNYHNHKTNKNDMSQYDLKQIIMEQLKLLQEDKRPLESNHQRLSPNKLLNLNLKGDDDLFDDYSKIYLIFDPIALQNKDSSDLTSLVSRILSQSSSAIEKMRREKNKANRHKGIMVKDKISRRYKRDSKESYGGGGGGGGGDMDDEYRPKRPRYDHGGGGGGGGGRTAIPYISHRGDIYEKQEH